MKKRQVLITAAAVTVGSLAFGVTGCASGAGSPSTSGAAARGSGAAASPVGCAVASGAMTPVNSPEDGGSTVALAHARGKTLAFVADADAKAIVTFDVDARKVLASTKLAATPEQVLVRADGLLAVSLRDGSTVAMYNLTKAASPLALACAAPTPAEPIGLAETKSGELLVTSGWGRALTAYGPNLVRRGVDAARARAARGGGAGKAGLRLAHGREPPVRGGDRHLEDQGGADARRLPRTTP